MKEGVSVVWNCLEDEELVLAEAAYKKRSRSYLREVYERRIKSYLKEVY